MEKDLILQASSFHKQTSTGTVQNTLPSNNNWINIADVLEYVLLLFLWDTISWDEKEKKMEGAVASRVFTANLLCQMILPSHERSLV